MRERSGGDEEGIRIMTKERKAVNEEIRKRKKRKGMVKITENQNITEKEIEKM